MKQKFSLKDALFNEGSVSYLADLFKRAVVSFQRGSFKKEVMEGLGALELKQRIVQIAQVLENYLPKDFKKASKLILKALPPALDPLKTDNDFGSFIFAPLGEFVVRNGLKEQYLEVSFTLLCELTQRFSMEDAMRSFLNTFPEETLEVYKEWVVHDSYHVRRLVSESLRPLLPWAKRITVRSETAIPFLTALHADKTRFVTRSVANHLNDISKTNPEMVIEAIQLWRKIGNQNAVEFEWMTKHALRTLVKKGNKTALSLLGYTDNPKIAVEQFSVSTKKIVRGGVLSFECIIAAIKDVSLMIDYSIDFVKANGTTKPKVFKIKKVHLKKSEQVLVTKNHRFVKDATTFTLYPGTHTVTLHINGVKYSAESFDVL